jgi:hypothetical protein
MLSTFLKESKAYEIIIVCPFVYYLEWLLNKLDFNEIQYGVHAFEGDLETTIFNPLVSIFPKWRTFELLRCMKN